MNRQKMKPYAGNQNRFIAWALLIIACAAALSFAAVTGAKYVLQWTEGVAQADAKAFYFTSDLLTGEGVNTPVYQLANFVPGDGNGSSRITFTLRNYTDELRVSEANISYTVMTDNPNITSLSGTITVASETETVSLSVPDTCFSNGKASIRVTATATSPYAKTLEAVFELYKKIESVGYSVHDAINSNTVTLTVTTDDKAGTVNITYPDGVYPDRTDNRLTNDNGTCSFNANANAQYSFVFFKTTPVNTYTSSRFTVS